MKTQFHEWFQGAGSFPGCPLPRGIHFKAHLVLARRPSKTEFVVLLVGEELGFQIAGGVAEVF